MSLKQKLRIAGWTAYAYVRNRHAEWVNNRLENSRRPWTAHRIGGGGVVPLGRVTKDEAIAKVAQWGSVRFVDVEVACIMFSDKT
jgi:hypothetical protein